MFCTHPIRLILVLIFINISTSSTEGNGVSIKRCCSPGFGLSGSSCVLYRQVDLRVAVKLPDAKNVKFMTIKGHEKWDQKCRGDDHKIQEVKVNNFMFFTHVEGSTFFPWKTPEGNEWLVDTFCMEALYDPYGRKDPVFVVRFCRDDLAIKAKDDEIKCQQKTCIRKCCPMRMILDDGCSARGDQEWIPTFYSAKDPGARVQKPNDLVVLNGFPRCSVRLKYEKYRLLENGWVNTMDDFLPRIPPSKYCIDLHTHDEGVLKEEVFACYEESDHYCRTRHVVVDLVLMVISCIFLAMSCVIYTFFRKPRSSNLDRCVIAFLMALLLAFISIIINRQQHEASAGFFCSFTGTMNHLGILATYFWLTVLCFHVWFSIRSGKMRDEKLLYVAYSFYGWGVPLIVALTPLHIPSDYRYQLNRPRADFLPSDCWFKDSALRWGYQYGFMLILFFFDFILFCCSVVVLKRKKQGFQHMRYQIEGTYLNSKLLLILFFVWVVELIPWLLEVNGCSVWVSTIDGIAALCGVYIFIALFRSDCCGSKILKVQDSTTKAEEENGQPPTIELFENPSSSRPSGSNCEIVSENNSDIVSGN